MSTDFEDPVDFIKVLKSQHRTIISTVCEIDDQVGGPSDLKNSVDKLNRITEILFDHLEKEDKKLYPTLINHKETEEIGKKYYYDMERLSCIALDFYKRYCVNKEGLKIFVEDFINGYSLFKGLLKVRIKREETELYPAFILLHSGVLHSEVLDYLHEHESRVQGNQRMVFLYSHNQPNLEALTLALEIEGYKVISTRSRENALHLLKEVKSDLILLDVDSQDKELTDLIVSIKKEITQGVEIIGYTNTETKVLKEELSTHLDHYIPKVAADIEKFSGKVKQLLNK